jgi:prevent-host-death family protein
MQVVNIHEAKTQLSKLLEQVQSGEDVVIAKAGMPIVRLIPFAAAKCEIAPPGSLTEQGFWIADDFDAPVDELFDCLKTEPELG